MQQQQQHAGDIVLKDKTHDMTSLQLWIQRHGHQIEYLQLHGCYVSILSGLRCAQLHSLLLHGVCPVRSINPYSKFVVSTPTPLERHRSSNAVDVAFVGAHPNLS
jgi:hypothetical protein